MIGYKPTQEEIDLLDKLREQDTTMRRALPKEALYMGRRKLKNDEVELDYTEEMVAEYLKCAEDPIYFVNRWVKIVSVDDGLIPFKTRQYQDNVLDVASNNRNVILKFPRQSGKSTVLASGFILHEILFREFNQWGILANKATTAREILSRVRRAYEHLPFFLQQGVKIWNKGSIELGNDSSVIAESSSSDAVRGFSFSGILLDEFAHHQDAVEFFASTYPVISSGKNTKVLIVSTPNGMGNLFHKMWKDAEVGKSSFIPLVITWDEVPGRDEEFKATTIGDIGETKWMQEYECSFLSSANTLVSLSVLAAISTLDPIETLQDGKLFVFDEPIKDHQYMITVDTARGLGEDYSTANVFDITKIPYEQVARYRSNTISPLLFPTVIHSMADQYNQAYVLIEINEGLDIANSLYYDIEYENVLMVGTKDKAQVLGGWSKAKLGLKQSTQTKKVGCSTLKSLVERNRLILKDFDTVSELITFTNNGRGSFEAEGNDDTDDLAMSLVIFGWATTQTHFTEMTDTNIRTSILGDDGVRQSVTPFGFIENNLPEAVEIHHQTLGPMKVTEGDGTQAGFEKWMNS
ncbi:MAG: terminase family protein [Candidatus Peribacteraceae bacterium]|nr:terminase family protein [Candidatus Peribacteraceae bacterium]